MGKYTKFGTKLDAAFKDAREQYLEAWNELQQAEKAENAAKQWQAETYRGENEARRQRARAAVMAAEANFKAVSASAWAEFERQRDAIRRELAAEIRADHIADPDTLDTNALELLKTGVLTADDYEAMAAKYDTNPAMLKVLAKYVKETADSKELDATTRGRMYTLYQYISKGESSTMRTWDSLVTTSQYCSGSKQRNPRPSYVLAMLENWDHLSAPIIDAL